MHCRLSHKIGSLAFMGICMAWMALGCQDDKYILEPSTGKIDFQITSDGGTASRSGSDVSFDIDGQELSLVWTVEENTDSVQAPANAETRGVAIDDDNLTSIYTTAIYPVGDGGKYYFKDEKVDVISQKGTSGHFWPEESLSFFAYAFSGNHQQIDPTFQRSGGKCIGSFSYALPTASTEDAPKDATAQPDVVFAITPDWTKDKDNGQVPLQFHHALSAIVFKVGNMPSDIQLESIAISGVYASGSCEMSSNPSVGKPQDILFEWECSGNQEFTYTENLGSVAPQADVQMGGDKAIFMMLPQEMSDETKLVFTFSVGGKEYVLEKNFKDIGEGDNKITAWKADYKYTFKIGIPDDIDVEVDDMVESTGLVKKDVIIQNTGIVTGYIRAAIVGYWKNAEGVIEAPWSPDNGEGTFVKADDWGTYWKKGADGFYYHKAPVGGNQFTQPLFNTYTLNNVAESHKDLTLEISIVAQIIPEDQKNLWGELNDSSN